VWFPPYDCARGKLFRKNREEWGSLGCDSSEKIKIVGQECPTHTGIAGDELKTQGPSTLQLISLTGIQLLRSG
jgi:hypothetical protein